MSSTKTYRIGTLGLHHDHVWGALDEIAHQLDNAELVAVADPNQPLLDKAKEAYGCTAYRDYAEMLDNEDLDAVYVFASNKVSEDLTVEAASRGLHCLVEKPMASTLQGAEKMLAAARENDVRLMINWPFAWWPQLQHAITLAQSGAIGQLWQVKYRAAHSGPVEEGCSEYFCHWLYDPVLNGGGALMDYCCYGSVLADVLLGMPSTVTGVKLRALKKDLHAEDNAIFVLTYPHAMATTEASWTQIGKLTAYTTAIYGETGTLFVEPRQGARLLKATAADPEGAEVEVPELEPHRRAPGAHFLWGIETGNTFTPLCESSHGRNAQEILEAGLQSAESGCGVAVPLD